MVDDRRKHRRFAVRLPATLFLGIERWTVHGHIADLSAGGAFVTAPARLEAGDAIHIALRWHGHQGKARGAIIRAMKFGSDAGAAVVFTAADPVFAALVAAIEQTGDAPLSDQLSEISDVMIWINGPPIPR